MLALFSTLFSAQAGLIPHGRELPTTVTLFERARYTTAEGKVKVGGCDAALAEALSDLDARVRAEHHEVVLGIWPTGGRNTWTPATEVECIQKGKKTIVGLEALILRPGLSSAYPEIDADAARRAVGVLYGRGGSFALQTGPRILDVDGALQLHMILPPLIVSDRTLRNPPTWAAMIANERLVPQAFRIAKMLIAVPEVTRIEIVVSVQQHREGEERPLRHALVASIPRDPILANYRGKIGARQLMAKSTLLFTPDRGEQKRVIVPAAKIEQKK